MTPQDRSDLLAAAEARVFARLRESVDFVYSGRSIMACFKKDLLAIFADPPEAEKAKPCEHCCYIVKPSGEAICDRCGMQGVRLPGASWVTWTGQAKPPEQPAASETRKAQYSIGRGGEDEPDLLLLLDHQDNHVLAHSKMTEFVRLRELVELANGRLGNIREALAAQRREFEEMVKGMPRLFDADAPRIFIDRDALLARLRAAASEGKK